MERCCVAQAGLTLLYWSNPLTIQPCEHLKLQTHATTTVSSECFQLDLNATTGSGILRWFLKNSHCPLNLVLETMETLRAALSGNSTQGYSLIFMVTCPEKACIYVWSRSSVGWSLGSLLDAKGLIPFRQVFFNLTGPPHIPPVPWFSLWWNGVGLCVSSWRGVWSWGYAAWVGFSCGQGMRKERNPFLLPLTWECSKF